MSGTHWTNRPPVELGWSIKKATTLGRDYWLCYYGEFIAKFDQSRLSIMTPAMEELNDRRTRRPNKAKDHVGNDRTVGPTTSSPTDGSNHLGSIGSREDNTSFDRIRDQAVGPVRS